MAQESFRLISDDSFDRGKKEQYCSFAKTFPSLIHSCGLAQAVAFAASKNGDYLNDLAEVIGSVEAHITPENLAEQSRMAETVGYMRLTRRALSAASWLKRYTETFDAKTSGDAAANVSEDMED
jgi:CRISPR-associated protein Cmr5